MSRCIMMGQISRWCLWAPASNEGKVSAENWSAVVRKLLPGGGACEDSVLEGQPTVPLWSCDAAPWWVMGYHWPGCIPGYYPSLWKSDIRKSTPWLSLTSLIQFNFRKILSLTYLWSRNLGKRLTEPSWKGCIDIAMIPMIPYMVYDVTLHMYGWGCKKTTY